MATSIDYNAADGKSGKSYGWLLIIRCTSLFFCRCEYGELHILEDKMIQYLGEHKLFNEKYIIFILFCIFLIEFKNYFSHKNKEKGYTLVISLMYLGEAILFLMPYENYIVDIMCTLFGIVLILCLILRYKSRKG